MRIFPDSNVLIAAAVWPQSICGKFMVVLIEEQKHDLIIGEYVFQEVREKLRATFGIPQESIDRFEQWLRDGATAQPTPLALAPYRVTDLDDRVVLTAALNAKADILISNDTDLLVMAEMLHQVEGLIIIAPDVFFQARGTLW